MLDLCGYTSCWKDYLAFSSNSATRSLGTWSSIEDVVVFRPRQFQEGRGLELFSCALWTPKWDIAHQSHASDLELFSAGSHLSSFLSQLANRLRQAWVLLNKRDQHGLLVAAPPASWKGHMTFFTHKNRQNTLVNYFTTYRENKVMKSLVLASNMT